MHDYRQCRLLRHLKKLLKSGLLNRFGRVKIVIIQPGFTDSHDLGMPGQGFDPGVPVGLNGPGVMGMDAYRGKNEIIPVCNGNRLFNPLEVCFHPDRDNGLQTGVSGSLNDFRPV